MKLGIDIGRVLITPESSDRKSDTSFIGGSLDDALRTPPYEGMFENVPRLVEFFKGNVWLVSKARQRMQEKTRLWLLHHHFYEKTGISPNNLRFCIERHQKADHCIQLGITHFIDDRLDVLGYLRQCVRHRYLFGPQRPGTSVPSGVTHVIGWEATVRVMMGNQDCDSQQRSQG